MQARYSASAVLGIECLDVAHDGTLGSARTRITVSAAMVNGHDICHGGFHFCLADSTFAPACNAGGTLTVAAACDITFVTSGHLGNVLVATAAERTTFGRIGITDVTLTRQADGALVAECRGRSRALPTPAPPTV